MTQRNPNEKIKTLPDKPLQVLKSYLELPLGKNLVTCPYHINTGRTRDLRVMVGKGTVEEIISEVRIWSQLKGLDLNSMTNEQIRSFMRERGIGIDCSGLVYHILDAWLESNKAGKLNHQLNYRTKSIWQRFKIWLRPAENTGANTLTNSDNTDKIELKDVMPGDLIRSKVARASGDHILLVIETKRDSKGNLVSFKYAHSTMKYGNANGVRIAEVAIINPNGELKDQDWQEQDTDGTKYTLEGLLVNYDDNGLRRPKYWSKLQ